MLPTRCYLSPPPRPCSPGGEVFDSYGPGKSRADLLINYGFVAVAAIAGEDVADLPGDAFWAEAEEALLLAAAEGADEESAADPLSHREALRSLLGAVGMTPGDTTVRVTADGVGENAMEWCQLAVTTRSELAEAERFSLGDDPDAPGGGGDGDEEMEGSEEDAWAVITALMDGPGSTAMRQREERARRVLTQLCARTLRGYPEWAHGLQGEERGPATGAAAAGMVLSSEIRALNGALESLAALRK